MQTLGFHGLPRVDFIERPKAHLPASGYAIDGARWRIFRASLEALAALPLRGIVLVNGPIDSALYYYADHLLEDGARGYSMLLGARLGTLEAAGSGGRPPG